MINIFIIKNVEKIDDNQMNYLKRLLPLDRQNKINNQVDIVKAKSMTIGSILVRYAIKKVFNIPISKQEFTKSENGKPYLMGYKNIYFNVSHSNGYVVCAISNKEVGIDIQYIKEYKESLSKYICNEEELNMLEKSNNKLEGFTKLWSKKESYIKMLGMDICQVDLKKLPIENIETIKLDDYYISYCINDI